MSDIWGGSKTVTTFNAKLREAFEQLSSDRWRLATQGAGHLVTVDGNSCGSSYLVISLDPLSVGSEVRLETFANFGIPIELSVGLSASQRTLGQEFAVEIVSTEPETTFAEIPIASMSQATTTLTVTTAQPHGLRVGMRIGIYGSADARLNYPAVVVASTPSPTQFTVTAGPGGTIQSLTAGPVTSGMVYIRPAVGGAINGSSLLLENASPTNGSFYVRSEGGDATPIGGTITGNHAVTVGATNSVQAVNAALNYAFRPTTEYRLAMLADRLQWMDNLVDAVTLTSNRANFTQICPNPDRDYKVRFRAVNHKGLTVPAAEVVSATKTGTTTTTIVTAAPHGFVTGDLVQVFGLRDQTNFANVTTPAAVTVVNATTFTIVMGTAVTATSFGGFVCRPNGGLNMQGIIAGGNVQSITSASNVLSVVTNVAVTGLLIGDLVNLVGVRDNTTGASLGLDGSYRVRDIQTTTVFLEPVGTAPTGNDVVLTNCGGVIVRRTDLRVSFVRLFDFERARVEFLARPTGDLASAVPVSVNNTVTINQPTLATGSANIGNVALQIPLLANDIPSAAITSTATTAAITPSVGTSYEINIPVTGIAGTAPTLDVGIEESDDAGANWFRVYDFPRITAIGMYRSPKLPLTGNRIRYVQTVGGTTPSFTRSLNRLQSFDSIDPPIRQLVDRTIALATLNSTTPSLNVQGCRNVQLVVSIGTAGTPPAIQLEGSDDNGATWYSLGSPLTATASSTVQLTVVDVQSQLLRARVSTAGVTVIPGYVLIKGF